MAIHSTLPLEPVCQIPTSMEVERSHETSPTVTPSLADGWIHLWHAKWIMHCVCYCSSVIDYYPPLFVCLLVGGPGGLRLTFKYIDFLQICFCLHSFDFLSVFVHSRSQHVDLICQRVIFTKLPFAFIWNFYDSLIRSFLVHVLVRSGRKSKRNIDWIPD